MNVEPSINVLGAYFPDWLFCIAGATVLCFALHAVLNARGWLAGAPSHLLALGYPALATVLSLSAWLVFFQH